MRFGSIRSERLTSRGKFTRQQIVEYRIALLRRAARLDNKERSIGIAATLTLKPFVQYTKKSTRVRVIACADSCGRCCV